MADEPKARRWPAITVDALDAAAAAGAVLFVVGASAVHWGLALMMAGAALVGGAVWLNRRR